MTLAFQHYYRSYESVPVLVLHSQPIGQPDFNPTPQFSSSVSDSPGQFDFDFLGYLSIELPVPSASILPPRFLSKELPFVQPSHS